MTMYQRLEVWFALIVLCVLFCVAGRWNVDTLIYIDYVYNCVCVLLNE